MANAPSSLEQVTIEEYNSDDERNETQSVADEQEMDLDDIETDSEESEEEIIASETAPYMQERPNIKIKFTESRDNLLSHNDNYVIFITLHGDPLDNGGRELLQADLLPQYKDLTFERAKVTSLRKRVLISLPLKIGHRVLVEPINVKNCIKSLVDVVYELQLTSFSICKTESLDNIPWDYILKQIRKHMSDMEVNVTICRNLVVTPNVEERLSLIREKHSSAIGGHKGVTKTYNRLRIHYYWENMKKDIQDFIRKCRPCQLRKLTRVKTKQPMVITDTPGAAFDKVAMDIVGPLPMSDRGNSYILTMQDLLTKYSVAVPLKEATSLTIADAFTKNFICIYGAPQAILTDQGSNFLTSLMRNLAKKFNIKQYKTTAYHPQSNGSIERSHHVLTEYLKTQITKDTNWDDYVALAMFSYNTSIHESTKYSPFELVFGRLARLPSSTTVIEENIDPTYHDYLTNLFNRLKDTQTEAQQNLIRSKGRSKFYYDQRIHARQFNEGDFVFLLKEPVKGKFSDQYSGPYKVLELLPHHNVKILFKNTPRIVHANKLKLAHLETE